MVKSKSELDVNRLVLEKTAPWVFIVVLAYFVGAAYWIYQSYLWGYKIISEYSFYASHLKEPWWIAIFYSSELGGLPCTTFRFIAGIFALYSAFLFLKSGKTFTPQIKRNVSRFFVFEAAYFLALIPSVILGFVYPFFEGKLWYFREYTPAMPILLVAGVSCLFMVLFIPPALLKLRSRIVKDSSRDEIVKWVAITCVLYLFVVFWLNYTLAWIATVVPWGERAQPGLSLLFEPLNLVSFAATTVGLLVIALSALIFALPAIKKSKAEISLKRVGAVMIAFVGYLALGVVLYFIAGGYAGQPTVWHEIVVPHNPDLWSASFLLLGLRLLSIKPKSG